MDEISELMIQVRPDVVRALRESESNVIEEILHVARRAVIAPADPILHIEHFNIAT